MSIDPQASTISADTGLYVDLQADCARIAHQSIFLVDANSHGRSATRYIYWMFTGILDVAFPERNGRIHRVFSLADLSR